MTTDSDPFIVEVLKYLQALAVGVLGAVATYLGGVTTGGKPVIFGLLIAVLTRAVGWLVSRLEPKAPPVLPPPPPPPPPPPSASRRKDN